MADETKPTLDNYTGVKYIQDGNYVDPNGNVLGPAPKKETEVETPVAEPTPAPAAKPTPDVAVKEGKKQ